MIDILLVLLIIFMITQPLSRMAIDVQVPPPDSTTHDPARAAEPDRAGAGDDGGYAINGQPVPKDQLDTQIHAIYDHRPAKLLFIKAGANRIYQDVIEAMDVARGAGVQVIGFTPQEAEQGVAPRRPGASGRRSTRGLGSAPACFLRARRLRGGHDSLISVPG